MIKRKTLLGPLVNLVLLTAGAFAVEAQTDLSVREALYFTGSNASHIDLKKDKYVARGGTMQLKTSEAAKCAANSCDFNIGFIGFRTGSTSTALSSYALLQVENGGLVGNTIYFAAAETTKQGVLPLTLSPGVNKVTFTIDPYKKTAETNERNNSFSVIINVIGGSGKP
jgi:hypothetical protein